MTDLNSISEELAKKRDKLNDLSDRLEKQRKILATRVGKLSWRLERHKVLSATKIIVDDLFKK